MSIATAPTVIASRILDAAGRRGLDSAILCSDIGINERSLRSSTKVPLEKLFSLWEVTTERICDPGFPVDVTFSTRSENREPPLTGSNTSTDSFCVN